jgi:hypothetical protein
MPLPLLNNPSIVGAAGVVESITNVQEPGGQSGSWGIDQVEQLWQGSRVYQNRMRLVTTHPYVGFLACVQAIQDLGISIGNYYEFPLPELSLSPVFPTEQDTGSFLQRISGEQETDDARQWIFTFDYGPFDIVHELGSSNITYGSVTPLDFPPVVRWSTAKYHRAYTSDVNGNPFINTAGDPLENPPQREESTQCLTLILWNPTYDEPYAQSFRDTINSDVFLGFNPGIVKCKDIDGERLYTSDYGYVWRIKFEFEMRQIVLTDNLGRTTTYGWQDLVLNAGFRAFGGATGQPGALLPIIIGQVPVTSPILLRANGTAIIPGAPADVAALNGNQAIFLIFNNFPISEFAGLNIDQNILTQNQ